MAGLIVVSLPAAARMPPSPIDQGQLKSNAQLYETARTYFPTDHYQIAPKRVFRLTRDQLDQTVRALLPGFAIASIKDTMPRDPLQTNYEYAEILSFNQSNLAPLRAWIGEIAAMAGKKPDAVIGCAKEGNARACLEREARSFIGKAFRGDVEEKRAARIVDFFVAGAGKVGLGQAVAELVEVVLSSPSFLFRKELDVDGAFRLTPVQRLQAITYTLADVPPEKLGLMSGKAQGYFVDASSTQRMIDKVLAATETKEKLKRFFWAWLELRKADEFTISQKVFPEFKKELADAMLVETERFLRDALARPTPRLKDITQATQSFVSAELKEIYGSRPAAADGSRLAPLDKSQRLGIFSQPAVLASHSGPTDTRPIKRGTFWVRKALCLEMGAVPQGLDISLKEIGPSTERKKIENSTRLPACRGCHRLIDPLGFFQEHYDALGRWRTEDNGFPVDASIKLGFLEEGPLSAKGPVEALKALTGSAMFKQCFVRQLYRFYMGRQEEPADDPLLRRLFFDFADNDEQRLLGLLEGLATSERIQRRE